MKSLRYIHILIYGLLMALALTGCRTHRKVVVRGSDAVEVQIPDIDRVDKVDRPDLSGWADNDVTRALMREAYSWMGTPYKYGGKDRKGADCSGFVMVVYHDALSIDLPRVSRDQGEYCKRIKKEQLLPGDLVFFVTGKAKHVSHVGIYIGNGRMIHASSTKGVIVTDITQKYYVDHFHHCGRVEEYYQKVKRGR